MASPQIEDKKLFTLKVLIEHERNRVLFAEANGDFVDVLCSFLTLPIGTIVRLLEKNFSPHEASLGSLNTLYNGLKKISSSCFWTEEAKLMFLYPRNPSENECQKLKMDIDDTEPTKYYICENCKMNGVLTVTTFSSAKCDCGKLMSTAIELSTSVAQSVNDGFTLGTASFVIRDDLHVMPNVIGSSLQLLNSLGIKKMSEVQVMSFSLGCKEVISLLKCAMVSKTPLSDLFLHTRPSKLEMFCSALPQGKVINPGSVSAQMVVRAVIQKSTNKVLFAQVEEGFVDLLFGMLAIPLGRVVHLLGGNTSLGSVDNLYSSVSLLNTGRYLKSQDVRNMLLHPTLPPRYLSKNRLFELPEKHTPELSYKRIYESGKYNFSLVMKTVSGSYGNTTYGQVKIKDPRLNGAFVKGPAMYMVTDDLLVTPCSSISAMCFIDESGISFSDIDEIVLNIGAEEALNILKASLTTSSALTNGLDQILKKHYKREK